MSFPRLILIKFISPPLTHGGPSCLTHPLTTAQPPQKKTTPWHRRRPKCCIRPATQPHHLLRHFTSATQKTSARLLKSDHYPLSHPHPLPHQSHPQWVATGKNASPIRRRRQRNHANSTSTMPWKPRTQRQSRTRNQPEPSWPSRWNSTSRFLTIFPPLP